MFVGTRWKAVCLWYKLMLTNCFYSQKQVGKGRNLIVQVCQKLCAPEENQPIQTTSFSYLMIIFFNQDQKTNSQNNRYHCSDPKDVPIVVHTQDWLKVKPDEPQVEGNVASQLTRIETSRLFHLVRI